MHTKVHILFIVIVAVTSCLGSAADLPQPGVCGTDLSDRIYGGNITGLTSYPWTAILIFREAWRKADLFHCGGSLISNRYVLTAAHCIDDLTEDYTLNRIRLGEWDLLSNPDCKKENGEEEDCNDPPLDVGIEKMIKHEGYDNVTLINDIALIKLNESVTFTDTMSPVCLPRDKVARNKDTNGLTFTAVGWGNTEHKNGTYEYGSRYKLHVSLKGVNQTYCDEVYDEDEILPSQMCAGAVKGMDTCQGDSGGGLVSAVDGYYHQFGVVSYGYGCGRRGVPGIYTRVTSFLDWIEDNME
uniref:Putative transmembrane protease n=1 Tax=Psorophora albipes TaxID=869069 RepID=T1D4G1_9DIPT